MIFTPGHICLYLNQSKILITGDALIAVDGELQGPNLQATYDMNAALKSLKKFTQYDIETVICYPWWDRLSDKEEECVVCDFMTSFHGGAGLWALEDANDITRWDNRISVIDQLRYTETSRETH